MRGFSLTDVNVRAVQIRQDNPVTLADDLSLPGPINQIRGVRRCGLFDWYYVSLCCEENWIYKVETDCLWEVSQYGACQTLISTEGPLCWGKVTLWVKCQLGCDCHVWNVLVWQWCHCTLSVLEITERSSSWQQLLHQRCNHYGTRVRVRGQRSGSVLEMVYFQEYCSCQQPC